MTGVPGKCKLENPCESFCLKSAALIPKARWCSTQMAISSVQRDLPEHRQTRGTPQSLGPNPDHSHHPARLAKLRAMREEARGIACGAAVDHADVLGIDARVLQLAPVCLD